MQAVILADVRTTVARQLAAALLATTFFAAHAPVSMALEAGVHADPGSPASKEYALPLNQARHTGSGHGGSGLFGAGISRHGGAASDRAGSGVHGASRGGGPQAQALTGGRTRGRRASSGSAEPSLPPAVTSAARTRGGSGPGSLLALLGGAVAVLALGALAGTVLRGRRSASSA